MPFEPVLCDAERLAQSTPGSCSSETMIQLIFTQPKAFSCVVAALKGNEILEIGLVTGLRGDANDKPMRESFLKNPDAAMRIAWSAETCAMTLNFNFTTQAGLCAALFVALLNYLDRAILKNFICLKPVAKTNPEFFSEQEPK